MSDYTKRYALGYLRVSTKVQADGISLTNQKEQIQNFAHNNNVEIIGWYKDPGVSAKTANRPGLMKMLRDAQSYKGKLDYVIVYDMSRMTRNMSSYYSVILPVLDGCGIKVVDTRLPLEATPEANFSRGLSMLTAQYDNEKKSSVVKDNMRAAAMDGRWVTTPPLGFKTKKVDTNSHLSNGKRKTYSVLIEDHTDNISDSVRTLLERYSQGDITVRGLTDIAQSLGVKGKKGKIISYNTVRSILSNAAYCGYVCTKLTDYTMRKGKFDGLISRDMYERNQRLLSQQGRHNKDSEVVHYNSKNFIKNDNYPLKGVVRCQICGTPLRGNAPTSGSGTPSPRYSCNTKGHGSLGIDKVHNLFVELLETITPEAETLALFKTIVKETLHKERMSLGKKIVDLEAKISKIEDRKNLAIASFLDDKLTSDEKDSMVRKCNDDLIVLQLELDELKSKCSSFEASIEYVCNFMSMPAKLWRDGQFETKVALEKAIFPYGLTFDIKSKKFGTENISPLYSVIQTKKSQNGSNNSVWYSRRDSNPRHDG